MAVVAEKHCGQCIEHVLPPPEMRQTFSNPRNTAPFAGVVMGVRPGDVMSGTERGVVQIKIVIPGRIYKEGDHPILFSEGGLIHRTTMMACALTNVRARDVVWWATSFLHMLDQDATEAIITFVPRHDGIDLCNWADLVQNLCDKEMQNGR